MTDDPRPAGLVPDRVLRWADEQPGRPAIVAGDRTMSYRRLAERAQKLAAHLRRLGVARDVPVAVCLARSPELVCASLAVMLAGGAYLILDVDLPERRTMDLLADSGTPVVVTDATSADRFRHAPVTVVDIGGRFEPGPSRSECAERDLCYVNYTSGSSGEPKGVLVQHDGLANLVNWYRDAYRARPGDRITQLARPSFDAYALEVWPCLANGATLYVAEDALLRSSFDLRDWLVKQAITVSFVPTPLAEELMELTWPDEIALRAMLTGGDRLRRHPPPSLPFPLFNNYGPTEITVVGTWCELDGKGSPDELPTIGRPLPNLHAHVLDSDGRSVAEGEPGELHLGGVGVARGYLGRETLTAERFLPDPLFPGRRMYATGDLVRWRSDGLLDFLGRVDDQIKVNGIRIEPAEIEAALRRHPGIRDAVVVLKESGGGSKLVAYFLPERTGETADTLRDHLAEMLPEYMVPRLMVALDSLPTTPRGKLDRRELAARDLPVSVPDASAGDDADIPKTPAEKLMADLWREVLDVETVCRHDSFFELGGDSLLATRLARKAAEQGLSLTAADLYDFETLKEIARVVE